MLYGTPHGKHAPATLSLQRFCRDGVQGEFISLLGPGKLKRPVELARVEAVPQKDVEKFTSDAPVAGGLGQRGLKVR